MTVDTKQKILMAARESFVEKGFAGTSMGGIAKSANVTRSLLFHHFGNKQQLWVAVKQAIVDEANCQQKTLPSITLPFKDFLRQLTSNSLDFYRSNPDIMRMIGWQRLEKTEQDSVSKLLSEEAEAWIDAFKHYQGQGELRKDIPVSYALTFFISLVSHVGLDQAPFIRNTEDTDHYIEFCIEELERVFTARA